MLFCQSGGLAYIPHFFCIVRHVLCIVLSPAVVVWRTSAQQAAVLSQMAQVYCFHEIYNTGVFTPVTAVTHYRWIRQCSLRGEHGSVTIWLCRKPVFFLPTCRVGQIPSCLPRQQLHKEENYFALPLPSSLSSLGT